MDHKYFLIFFLIGLSYIVYLVIVFIRTRVPFVVTPEVCLQEIIKHLPINSQSIIYDLGSGQGDVLFALEKLKPKKLVGYELSPLHLIYSKLKARLLSSRIHFIHQDFFQADLSEANIIYLFLVSSIIQKLWPKIKQEVKPGTLVVVLASTILGEKPVSIIKTRPQQKDSTNYYVYQV